MKNKILVALSFCAFALLSAARADWQADLQTESSKKDIPNFTGKAFARPGTYRLDVEGGLPISVIVDLKKKKAWTLMHAAKVVMDADMSKFEAQIPACAHDVNPVSCFEKSGYKKTGSETVDGHACSIYEGTYKGTAKDGSRDVQMKFWHPDDLKEIPSLRTIAKMADGNTLTTTFTHAEIKSQPASLFVVPKEYKRAGSVEDLMKSLKGFGR